MNCGNIRLPRTNKQGIEAMNDIQLTHFYPWKPIPDLAAPLLLQEFADNGAKNLVLIEAWVERLIREPGFCSKLKGWLRACGMNIFECHGVWGQGYDLNITELPRRKGMIEDHKLSMEYAAFFGCKTYTVHIGPYYEGMEKPVFEALEQLIPAAEKAGIILAIENGFDPGNSPDALLQYLKKFPSNYFGCCLDTGHANVMRPAPGKKMELYGASYRNLWNNDMRHEPDPIGKLADYLVTAHVHDNDGYSDAHMLPGTGNTPWDKWIPALKKCPRLVSLQNETGALTHRVSIRKMCETFDKLMKLQ